VCILKTMPAGETEAHRRLKTRAIAWALEAGFTAIADEVRLPRAPYRADVVAARFEAGSVEIAVFECKQARSDLLKDSAAEKRTRARLAELHARRVALEVQLAIHLPDLRAGETLFPEFDRYDFSDLRHEGFKAICAEMARLKSRLYGKTKFAKLVRWRAAHAFHIVAAPGICTAAEVPEGWGLLVESGATLEQQRRPVRIECPDATAVVAAIARAGTRRLLKDFEVLQPVIGPNAPASSLLPANRHTASPPKTS
jgi:hypothetical protein